MFRINCCDSFKKCRVFALATSRTFKSAVMKTCYCSSCHKFIVEIETTDYSDRIKTIRKINGEAHELFEKNRHNILFEVISSTGKFGWYLKYGEYGKVKKCYSNLRCLKLGKFRGNFEDIKVKNEFYNYKQKVC